MDGCDGAQQLGERDVGVRKPGNEERMGMFCSLMEGREMRGALFLPSGGRRFNEALGEEMEDGVNIWKIFGVERG